jgi:opacity protein-like surface antigen
MRFKFPVVSLVSVLFCLCYQFPARGASWPFGGAFNRAYWGIAGGPTFNEARANMFSSVTFLTTFGPLTIENTNHNVVEQTRGYGETFLGWGFQWMRWLYLGGRFGINCSSFTAKSSNTLFYTEPLPPEAIEGSYTLINKVEARLDRVEFIFDFKPGLVFHNKAMLYGVIGGATDYERLNVRSYFEFIDFSFFFATTQQSEHFNRARDVLGLRCGLGLEYLLSWHLSLHVSYISTHYGKVSAFEIFNSITNSGTVENGRIERYSIKPRRQVAEIGLSWYF